MARHWLKVLRKKNGFTAQQMADSIGITRTSYVLWEAGTKNPSGTNIYALARILGPEVHVHLAAENDAKQNNEGAA